MPLELTDALNEDTTVDKELLGKGSLPGIGSISTAKPTLADPMATQDNLGGLGSLVIPDHLTNVSAPKVPESAAPAQATAPAPTTPSLTIPDNLLSPDYKPQAPGMASKFGNSVVDTHQGFWSNAELGSRLALEGPDSPYVIDQLKRAQVDQMVRGAGGDKSAADKVVEFLGGVVGSIGTSLEATAPGAVAGAAAGSAVPVVGTVAGGIAGGAASMGVTSGVSARGEHFTNAYLTHLNSGLDEAAARRRAAEDSKSVAVTQGVLDGAANVIGIGVPSMIGRAVAKGGASAVKVGVYAFSGGAVADSAWGGATQIAVNKVIQGTYDPNRATFEDVPEAMLGEALGSGITGPIVGSALHGGFKPWLMGEGSHHVSPDNSTPAPVAEEPKGPPSRKDFVTDTIQRAETHDRENRNVPGYDPTAVFDTVRMVRFLADGEQIIQQIDAIPDVMERTSPANTAKRKDAEERLSLLDTLRDPERAQISDIYLYQTKPTKMSPTGTTYLVQSERGPGGDMVPRTVDLPGGGKAVVLANNRTLPTASGQIVQISVEDLQSLLYSPEVRLKLAQMHDRMSQMVAKGEQPLLALPAPEAGTYQGWAEGDGQMNLFAAKEKGTGANTLGTAPQVIEAGGQSGTPNPAPHSGMNNPNNGLNPQGAQRARELGSQDTQAAQTRAREAQAKAREATLPKVIMRDDLPGILRQKLEAKAIALGKTLQDGFTWDELVQAGASETEVDALFRRALSDQHHQSVQDMRAQKEAHDKGRGIEAIMGMFKERPRRERQAVRRVLKAWANHLGQDLDNIAVADLDLLAERMGIKLSQGETAAFVTETSRAQVDGIRKATMALRSGSTTGVRDVAHELTHFLFALNNISPDQLGALHTNLTQAGFSDPRFAAINDRYADYPEAARMEEYFAETLELALAGKYEVNVSDAQGPIAQFVQSIRDFVAQVIHYISDAYDKTMGHDIIDQFTQHVRDTFGIDLDAHRASRETNIQTTETSQRLDDGRFAPAMSREPTATMQSVTGEDATITDPQVAVGLFRREPTASDAPVFYSGLARAVESANLGKNTDKANAQQWMSLIRKGAKAEEIEWSGVEDYLNGLGRPVTRGEVLNFLADNTVQFQEVQFGPPPGGVPYNPRAALVDEHLSLMSKIADRTGIANITYLKDQGVDILPEDLRADGLRAIETWDAAHTPDMLEIPSTPYYPNTRWGLNDYRGEQLEIPGGENYRELILTMPQKTTATDWQVKRISETTGGDYEGWAVSAVIDGQRRMISEVSIEDAPTEADALSEARQYAPLSEDNKFTHAHWRGVANPLVHVRFNERTDAQGNRVLFIEEVQSDWHQQGREKGYKSEHADKLDKAKADIREVQADHDVIAREVKGIVDGLTEEQAYVLVDGEYNPDAYYTDSGKQGTMRAAKLAVEHAVRDPAMEGFRRLSNLENAKQALPELAERMDALAAKYAGLQPRLDAARKMQNEAEHGARDSIPDAPLKDTKSWVALGLKRMIRWAAENGFDKIAWTTGQQQAERYHLAKRITGIAWDENTGSFGADTGNGAWDIKQSGVDRAKLVELIGKDAADALIAKGPNADGYYHIDGQDIPVGGDGHKEFYDRVIPSVAKKLGGKPEPVTVGEHTVLGFNITDAMADTALKAGFPMFRRAVQPTPPQTMGFWAAADKVFDWISRHDPIFTQTARRIQAIGGTDAAYELGNEFRRDILSRVAPGQEGIIGEDYHSRTGRIVGQYISGLHKALGDIGPTAMKHLAGALRGEYATLPVEAVQDGLTPQVLANIRAWMDKVHQHTDANIKASPFAQPGDTVGYIQDYFPQRHDYDGKFKGTERPGMDPKLKGLDKEAVAHAFWKAAGIYAGNPNQDVLIADMIRNIQGLGGEVTFASNVGSKGLGGYALEKSILSRVLTVAPKTQFNVSVSGQNITVSLGDLMNNNAQEVLFAYATQMGRSAEFARRFGPRGEKIEEYFARIEAERRTQGLPPLTVAEIEALRTNVKANLHLLGRDFSIANPNTYKAMQWASLFTNTVTLSLATLASIPEMLAPSVRLGLRGQGYAFMSQLRQLFKLHGVSEDRQLALDLGVIHEHFHQSITSTMLEGGSIKAAQMTQTFFNAIGLTRYTQWTEAAATMAAVRSLRDWGKKAAKGDQKYVRWLREVGLTAADLQGYDPDNYRATTNEQIDAAVYQLAKEMIISPDAGEKPAWMSDPRFLLVRQIKSYMTGFNNTILQRMGREVAHGNLMPLVYLIGMSAASAGVYALREWLTWGKEGNPHLHKMGLTKDNPWRWAVIAVDRGGLMGPLQIPYSLVAETRLGQAGTAGAIAPAAGILETLRSSMVAGAHYLGTGDLKDKRTFIDGLSRLTPVLNSSGQFRADLVNKYAPTQNMRNSGGGGLPGGAPSVGLPGGAPKLKLPGH